MISSPIDLNSILKLLKLITFISWSIASFTWLLCKQCLSCLLFLFWAYTAIYWFLLLGCICFKWIERFWLRWSRFQTTDLLRLIKWIVMNFYLCPRTLSYLMSWIRHCSKWHVCVIVVVVIIAANSCQRVILRFDLRSLIWSVCCPLLPWCFLSLAIVRSYWIDSINRSISLSWHVSFISEIATLRRRYDLLDSVFLYNFTFFFCFV